jgi:hypothetical protein
MFMGQIMSESESSAQLVQGVGHMPYVFPLADALESDNLLIAATNPVTVRSAVSVSLLAYRMPLLVSPKSSMHAETCSCKEHIRSDFYLAYAIVVHLHLPNHRA